ncbi:hypothetical protein [Chromatium okenii]|uniref:Cas10/Cmr2 second palm domain-containing protein n=1 Tax=Chromatium okenii TaxID=61644 RepID=UPI0026ECD46F|nr:hypothetical protein [Chromatium okenii]MBV5309628.1 hypothetical protein [Chromatium okenii]
MVKLEISLKRVQTFIFEVPRLKAMLGANALVGQTMRHELPKLLKRGSKLTLQTADDPLGHAVLDPSDRDDPIALYQRGILARDGGHFIVLFDTEENAKDFRAEAEEELVKKLPGVLYEAEIEPFPKPEDHQRQPRKPQETALLDLPVLQVCQETGHGPASKRNKKGYWQGDSVEHRLDWGDKFYSKSENGNGKTSDIIGLLRPELYPDREMHWHEPKDLTDLAAGSYLALIHADGNGIGKRYKDRQKKVSENEPLAREAHGEAFFHSMRVAVRQSVVAALRRTFTEPGGIRPYEILMLGGDDLLLACCADQALDFARNYAEELQQYKLADGEPLTVAIGVAIAQETYPVHRLHELAESLASSAKRLYRALPDLEKTSVIDWQVVTQSWFAGVAEARKQSERIQYQVNGCKETLLLTGRPYRVLGDDSLDSLLMAARALDSTGDEANSAARSPLRTLRSACEHGRLMAEMSFARLPPPVRAQLSWCHGELWNAISDKCYLTRALDIVGLREISHLGKKP